MMPKTIELDGDVLEVAGILETMDMLNCTAEELFFWLDSQWMRQHSCDHCGTSWPLLEDVVGIAHLAEKYPQVGLNELVHKLHIEHLREARGRQLKRRTASLAQTQRQADPDTDPRSQRSYGRRDFATTDYQETEPVRGGPKRARRLRPEELEATRSYVAFEAEIPEEVEYENHPRKPERRGIFGRRQRS